MGVKLARIILYVQDVERLSEFYRQALGFPLVRDLEGNAFQLAETGEKG